MTNQERRRKTRYQIDKPVKIKDGTEEHRGRLADISSGGAAVNGIDDDAVFDSDQELELEMDDFGPLSGSVVRTLDDGFAMAFDLDEEGEEQLISEITGVRSGMEFE